MAAATETGFPAWVVRKRAWMEEALREACQWSSLSAAPPRLRTAVETALLSGGKRVRPALCLLACAAEGGEEERALPGAVAVEMIHAYSLVHDDLPAMDDDVLRRGQPTLHVVFDEATAILAGDALQALAFEVLATQPAPLAGAQIAILARAAGPAGMVGGQQLDLAAEGEGVDLAGVRAIHAAKTGALFGAALQLGACAAGADPEAWSGYAEAVGQLFQATDDILDATRSTEELGKTAGKDAAAGKPTLVAAAGLDAARETAASLAERARAALAALPLRGPREELADLPQYLLERSR